MKNLARAFLLIPFLSTIVVSLSHCQDLEVRYNLFRDSVAYVKDGHPQQTLHLRKGDAVKLSVTEFNPFIYDIELKLEETTKASSGGIGSFAAVSGLMPGMPSLMGAGLSSEEQQNGTGGLPLLDIPLLTVNDNPITLKGLFEKSRGSAVAMEQAKLTMQEITAIVEEVQTTHTALKQSEKVQRVSQLALANVDKIKHHSGIQPSMVKKICEEYYAAIFQKSLGQEMSLDDLLGYQDLPAKHELLMQKLKSKQGELTAKMGMLQMLSDQLTSLGLEDEAYRQYAKNLIDFQTKTKALNAQLKDGLTRTNSPTNLLSIQEIADLQLKLAEVMSSDFTWRSTVQPTADEVVLVIRVLQKRDSASSDEPVLVREKRLQLEVRGGLKVSASVGVNFGQFFSPGQSYSVSNGVIVGEDEGAFSPSMTSFLHFHGYRGQRATLGGSFGVGFPVLSSGDGQSIQFFLGPSLVLGANQKLVLSGGFMGGRVQRLAKGFRVGDVFDANNGDIPTRGKYDIGAFVGLSFNLGN